ncbi:helix-turn-helix domain-containing protein [Oleidesulfovibrio alaskensis]
MSSDLKLLGDRVRSLRKAKGMTQEDLAVAAESGAKYISELERGEANVTVTLIVKLAKGLEVDPSDLFENKHEADPEELKAAINKLMDEADHDKLKLLYRVAKDIVR